MRVAIRVDASPLIGGGHAMRCLTLADALKDEGAEVTFASSAMPEPIEKRIAASAHRLVRIPTSPELDRESGEWEEPPFSDEAQAEDAQASRDAVDRYDWMIVDHYLLGAKWHRAARAFAERLLVIDDLANRDYDCDILLDQTFGRSPADYDDLVPEPAKVLAGASYALLRPEFAKERAAALLRRRESRVAERVLVSLGTTDPGRASAQIVEIVRDVAPSCEIDLVLGPQSTADGTIDEDPRLTIHRDSRRMAELMRDADLAVGAAGSTSWERCCVGLPTIMMVLAQNQRGGASALAQAGAAIMIDNLDAIRKPLKQLLSDPEALSRMSAASFAITDGLGTQRVVAAMLGEAKSAPVLQLRPAMMADAEKLWLWRNDPITRSQSRDPEPINWNDHMRWLDAALDDPGRKLLIAESAGQPLGSLRFDSHDNGGREISVMVDSHCRGAGIGRTMLELGCAAIADNLYAAVRNGNTASQRVFESCGFKLVDGAEPGFVRYLRPGVDHTRKRA